MSYPINIMMLLIILSYSARLSTGYANDISLKYLLQRNSIDNPIFPKKALKLHLLRKGYIPYSLY
jgi:hypothetical protein